MAQWSDLPVELQEAIIGHLGEIKDVEEGKRDSVDFQALLALSQVERAAYLIARPYLWKRIDISTRSRKSIQRFAESVLPSSRPSITHVVCFRHDALSFEQANALETMLACGTLISLLPTVKSLSLGFGDWSTVLPPATLANLEELCIEETDETYREALDNHDSLELVQRCPNLQGLTCHAYHAEGLQKLYDIIRSLQLLRGVTLWDAYSPAEDYMSSSLAGTWRSPLVSFATNILVNDSILQQLATSVGATLQSLTIPDISLLRSVSPPLRHPQLVSLSLTNIDEETTFAKLCAFDDSPLQSYHVTAVVHSRALLRGIRDFVASHRSTLTRVDAEVCDDLCKEERDLLGDIENFCCDNGIAFTVY